MRQCDVPAGARIKTFRLKKDWSQVKLAVMAGVATNAVGLAERYGVCSQRTAELCAKALGVPVAMLVATPAADVGTAR